MSTPRKDAPVTLPNAPYRGIQSFRFIDQQIFAARAEEVWTLLSNSKLFRAVLLYGDSGTGKSSLINAGLIPRALTEGYIPNRLRIQPFAGREIKVERLRVSAEGEAPVFLPSNFTGLDGLPDDGTVENFEVSLTKFRQRLKEFRRTSKGEPRDADADANRTTGRPFLIFDQFEEFITLFEEAQRGGPTDEAIRLQRQGPKVQRQILVTLIKLIRDETLPVKILFSFREDYLAKLSPLFDLCPQLLNQALRLLPPKVEMLPEIIRAPFTNPKLREHFLQGEAHSELSEALAKKIADELGRHGARDTVNLTELQIVCLRLWQSAKPEELFKSEGIRGLLKSYGSDVFRDFNPELRDAAVSLLALMITASNTRNIIAEEDLLSRANVGGKFQPEELRLALVALAQTQIVRRELRRHLYFYEITSEYLVPWIKEQVAERRAAEERRTAREAQQKLEAQRAEAVAKLVAEERRHRRLRYLMAAMALMLLSAAVLGWIARRESKHAKAAELAAEAARQQTQYVLDVLKLVTSPNRSEALAGLTQVETLINQKKIPVDVAGVVLTAVLTSDDEGVRKAGLEFYKRLASEDPAITLSVLKATETNEDYVSNLSSIEAADFNSISESLPPRLYFHISDESQRARARQAAEFLTSNGYLVPGITNVGTKSPQQNELRYFRKDESALPHTIVELLRQSTGAAWEETYTSGYEQSSDIRPGHFEVWFGAAPGSPNGWLRAFVVDEKGRQIGGRHFVVTVTTVNGDRVKRQPSGYLGLPAGDYILIATSEGYEEIKQQFSIRAGEATKIPLLFNKKN